jgi:hypothetical protein
MSNKKMCWGKHKGDKPVAIFFNGSVIPEDYKVLEVCDVASTSAVQRLLKSETGRNYDIIRVDYNGEFTTEPYIAKKIETYLSKELYGKNIQFSNI